MAMTKIIDPRGWDFDRNIVVPIKYSSRGLSGADRSDFIKLAGHQFLDLIDNIKVAKDEQPVHVLALGASEAYGPNRNGDGFKEAHCKAHHHTFVKYGRWFRNHKNKDPKISYGYIKASAYNEGMRRVELLCMLNASKEAAARNGGFVADKELEKIARAEDIAVSMACRVPYDVCSNCQKQAKTRDDYCTEVECVGPRGEKRGGCRNNLTKVGEDGHTLHVDNPNPQWFDMSNVIRPADRIAYGAAATYLQKAASDEFLPGALAAELLGVTPPLTLLLRQDAPASLDKLGRGMFKLAQALAVTESHFDNGDKLTGSTLRAFDTAVCPPLTDTQLALLGTPGSEKSAAALAALADERIVLPLRDFARWVGKETSASAAAVLLPGVYRQLMENGRMDTAAASNPFACSEKVASVAVKTLARNLAPGHALTKAAVAERAMRSALRTPSTPNVKSGFWNEKIASNDPEAASLAEGYALYKLAALHRIAAIDEEFMLTARLAIGQNRV